MRGFFMPSNIENRNMNTETTPATPSERAAEMLMELAELIGKASTPCTKMHTQPESLGTEHSPLITVHTKTRPLGHAIPHPDSPEDMLAVPDYRYLIPALAKSAGGTSEAWETASWTVHSTTSLVCSDFLDYLHGVEENFWDTLVGPPLDD